MFSYLLTHPKYLRYWLAVVFSDLAYQIRNIVLLFLVYSMTHSSKAVAVMMVCEYAPNVLAPAVGVLGDRWNRKWTFIASNAGRAASILVILVLLPLGQVWIAYLGTLLGTVASMFASASSNGFQREFVPPEDRKTTSALRQVVYSGMILIGPPIATIIYSGIGLQRSLLLCCLLYALTTIGLITISVKHKVEASSVQPSAFFASLREGMSYSFRHPISRQLMVGALANGMVGGIINVLEIFVITDFLHLPKSMLGILLSVQGLAMLVAAPLIHRIKLSVEALFGLSVAVIGLGQWIMIIVPSFGLTLTGVLIEGLGVSCFMICAGTLQQTRIAMEYQGRFSTANNMVVTGVMTVTMLLVGWLHGFWSVQRLLILSGLAAMLISFTLNWMYRRPKPHAAADQPSVM